mmetsp:Transcript_59174/g.163387  ORF Transcript_59174/g.163387 Transcript_59174/m.163387 type:complete len:258 (-) Transcript_59174:110-883(-)
MPIGQSDRPGPPFLQPAPRSCNCFRYLHPTNRPRLDRELHDGVDNITVVVLERGDGLGPGAHGLVHHQLDVLGVHASLVHSLLIVARRRRVRARRRHRVDLRGAELLRGGALGLRAEVLDLGLAEDDVGVRAWALEHVRPRDDEEDVLRLLDGDADDVRHRLHAQLLHGLAALLLRPVLLASALALVAAGLLLLLLGALGVLRLLELRNLVLVVLVDNLSHCECVGWCAADDRGGAGGVGRSEGDRGGRRRARYGAA